MTQKKIPIGALNIIYLTAIWAILPTNFAQIAKQNRLFWSAIQAELLGCRICSMAYKVCLAWRIYPYAEFFL